MLKRTVTYDNLFDEGTITEDHYFHISKSDLIEMEMEDHKAEYTDKTGEKLTGARARLQRILDAEDGQAIIAQFKDMILRSYGKREGDRFLKNPQIRAEFESSEAFSQLLWELCTNPANAAEFINNVFPGDLEKVAEEIRQQVEAQNAANNGDGETPPVSEGPRVLTTAEAVEMDSDELQSGLATGRYKLSA